MIYFVRDKNCLTVAIGTPYTLLSQQDYKKNYSYKSERHNKYVTTGPIRVKCNAD